MGYVAAWDRLASLYVTKIFAEGTICQHLICDDLALTTDITMRRLGWAANAKLAVETLSPETLQIANAYSEGINTYLASHSVPLDLRITQYRPKNWTAYDSILVVFISGWVGLLDANVCRYKPHLLRLQGCGKEVYDPTFHGEFGRKSNYSTHSRNCTNSPQR